MTEPRRAIWVTQHALDRVRERFPALRGKPRTYLVRVIMAVAYKGQLFGEPRVRTDEFRLGTVPPGREIVVHIKFDRGDDNRRVVTTVLTKEEALNAGGLQRASDEGPEDPSDSSEVPP